MSLIKNLALRASKRARRKRAKAFRDLFEIDPETTILDLGSEDGSNIKFVLDGTEVRPENVYIADISERSVREGAKAFGFVPVPISETGNLPFPDKYFDIVYCSSVIEHVTVNKEEVWSLRSGCEFRARSWERQKTFAEEVERLGKQYFVQTPYRYFPIESHSWLPFLGWLPRRLQVPILALTNKFWVKKTSPDWHLLHKRELTTLFRGAVLLEERVFGMTKSIMAVHTRKNA